MPEIKVDKFEGAGITDDIVKSAAKLFSENYGIWGPLAEDQMGVKNGESLRLSMSKFANDIVD